MVIADRAVITVPGHPSRRGECEVDDATQCAFFFSLYHQAVRLTLPALVPHVLEMRSVRFTVSSRLAWVMAASHRSNLRLRLRFAMEEMFSSLAERSFAV